MSLVRDFDSSAIELAYSVSTYVEGIFCVILSIIGLVGISLVLLSTRYDRTARNKLIWSLCIADFAVCLATVVFHIMDLINGRYSSGSIGCMVQSAIYYTMCTASVFSLITFTLERYASIIFRVDLTSAGAEVLVVSLWVISILFVSIGYMTESSRQSIIGLGQSKLICRIAYWNSVPFPTWVSIIVIFTAVSLMAFAYIQIFIVYFNARVDRLRRAGLKKKKTFSENEQRLLKKSVTLVGFFALSYTPFCILVR